VFGTGSLREHTFADQALAHVFTKNNEYLANLVGTNGACTPISIFVGSHFFWKNFARPSPFSEVGAPTR